MVYLAAELAGLIHRHPLSSALRHGGCHAVRYSAAAQWPVP